MRDMKKITAVLLASIMTVSSISQYAVSATETQQSNTPVMEVGETYEVSLYEGDRVRYAFTPKKDGEYIITSEGDYDVYAFLTYNEIFEIASDDDSGEGLNFQLSATLTSGEEYILELGSYEDAPEFYISVMYESFTEKNETDNGVLNEDELLEIMENTAQNKMENYLYVDMDHNGEAELIGTYLDNNGIYQTWYCSSDGQTCVLALQNETFMDCCVLEELVMPNETHVVINAYRSMGTVKNYSILALQDNEIKCLISNKYGYVGMNKDGDITLNVEAYDGMYDPTTDSYMIHTWKDTYLYYDGTSYKEYGAKEITEADFLQYENASELKNTIESQNIQSDTERVEYKYYIRENGIIHVQCDVYSKSGMITYRYYTIRYSGKVLDDEPGEYKKGRMKSYFSDLEVSYVADSLDTDVNITECEKLYKEVLDKYDTAMFEHWDETMLAEAGLNYQCRYYTDNSEIGYTFTDIDKNGVAELLIGDTSTYQSAYVKELWDLYTVIDDKIVLVVSGWERSRYYLGSDCRIYYEGSGSAYSSTNAWYLYNGEEGKLILKEEVREESEHNGDTQWLYRSSSTEESISISKADALEVLARMDRTLYLPIEFTPFSEYHNRRDDDIENGQDNVKFTFDLEDTKNATEGTTIALSGILTLDDSVETTEKNLARAADSIILNSSDESKAKVLTCEVIHNEDKKSATLKVWITLYNAGTAIITAKSAYSPAIECEITVSEDTSDADVSYECDYTSEMQDFFINNEMTHNIKYFCQDKNFPASVWVSEKDVTVGSTISMFLTDTIYRGWDGWQDIIDASTSVEEAEKILASLLVDYQLEIKDLSETKTANKYAKMICDAFIDYSEAANLSAGLKSEELAVVKDYFSEDNIAKLLYEGKYDDLALPVNQILQQETAMTESWEELMNGFTQSAELSKALKKGFTQKIGNMEIGGGLSDIGKALNLISFSQDTLNYLYQLESLLVADEMYCEMLKYVENHCVYAVVQEAAGNLYSVINNGVLGIIADITVKAVDLAGDKILDLVLDKACNSCLPLAIIKKGFDWGVTISNTLFKTGTVQELKDSLRSQVYLANCLAQWTLDNGVTYMSSIGTDEEADNGKMFYYSLYMVWKARINAEETLQSMLKASGVEWGKNYSISEYVENGLKSYKTALFSEERMESMLGIAVSCPVNVEVYDANGIKLLNLSDGIEKQGYENGIYYYCSYNPLSKDYEKYVYYSEEANYRVSIVGIDIGLVDCTVLSKDDTGKAVEYYFCNKEIDSDTVININDISQNGVEYKVTKSDGEMNSSSMSMKTPDVITATAISLNQATLEMEKNEQYLLTVSFIPSNATNQNVVWTSSNDSIVSVNSDGVITALDSGKAIVSAVQGELKQTCEITVKEKVLNDNESTGNTSQSAKPSDNTGSLGNDKTTDSSMEQMLPQITPMDDGKRVQSGSCEYEITSTSTVTVTGLKKSKMKKLTIPKTITVNGIKYKVTAIAEKAFKNAKITNLTIGSNVKTIGASAFENCKRLTKVTIGGGITKINKNAFKNCKKLKNIKIQSTKLKSVGKNAFKGIKSTAKIRVSKKKLATYKKLLKKSGIAKKI